MAKDDSINPALNLQMAREAAERVGQHHDPLTRSLQQGWEHGWYHGTVGDIGQFDPATRGEATGAASAKKGYFFARDPSTPPAHMLAHDPESVALLKSLANLYRQTLPCKAMVLIPQAAMQAQADQGNTKRPCVWPMLLRRLAIGMLTRSL